MPSLTVKSMAEMLRLPAYSQSRILREQKYPKEGSQIFRTPYYSASLKGIGDYFRNGTDKKQLANARNKIQSYSQVTRRNNNLRVLKSFEASSLAKRNLELIKNKRVRANINNVEFRLSPDYRFIENDIERVLYINCRAQSLDVDIARLTLEVAHWVLEQQGVIMKLNQIEYYDLFSDTSYVYSKRRAKTISALEDNAVIIEAIWDTL